MPQGQSSIPVFYTELMLAQSDSFSPSAGKARNVLAAWQAAALPISISKVNPATPGDFCLAHKPAFVRAILSCESPNGFGNTRADVAHSLPYTTGAMIDAAHAAIQVGCACAPVSGFHHAHYDLARGYCTFNGLIVTARKLVAAEYAQRVLILDCDMHFGDGTEQIIEKLALQHCIENVTFGRWFNAPSHAAAYLATLEETVARLRDFDLILYQAGADVHVDDPLGGVLTTSQMIERDRIVFEAARRAAVPIAWNLAGGYQQPLDKVIALHANTMRESARVYVAANAQRS